MTKRDPLIEAVATRLRRVEQTGDPAAVPEAGAAQNAEALAATVRGDEDDLDALFLAGWLHWYRYCGLPEGEDRADLERAIEVLGPCYVLGGEPLPEPLLPVLAEWALPQAAALLDQTAAAPDRESASAAALLCRRILADIPADHDDRPAMLSGLGAALHVRFAYTGELDDLDGAITATRAVLPAGEQDGASGPQDDASTVQRAMLLDNLHDMLVARFGRSGGLADLDDASGAARMALDLTPTWYLSR